MDEEESLLRRKGLWLGNADEARLRYLDLLFRDPAIPLPGPARPPEVPKVPGGR